ncbi:PucR family transcriptional regulator [Solicola gregarius]|uniref:Helix-turn-helix domain-containing protein n=1 Tax=Solicola gregarius TaxID=2908642 RepID=A0AA46TIS2_9ACTN|nr:helix-turn-helix domain-containing protein [Solicola gregarius]UYM06061.1 helix-turn-helix domain-containing protein [Solicola gregarius]
MSAGIPVNVLVPRLAVAEVGAAYPGRADSTVTWVATADEDPLPTDVPGALVLGTGLTSPDQVRQAWRRWSQQGASALVVRASALIGEAQLEPAGPTWLLTIGERMSWVRLATLVTADLDAAGPRTDGADDTVEWDDPDLYEIANYLSSVLVGPVTIEDMASRILAFSSDHDRADEPRKRSILERQVSHAHNKVLADGGVFTRLFAGPDPIYVEPPIDGARPRAAVRIAAGDEMLGSIWVVVDQPPSPLQRRVLVESAAVVALALTRSRLVEDARSSVQHRLVSRLLEGGSEAVAASRDLGTGARPAYVLAVRRDGRQPEPELDPRFRSLVRLLTTYLQSIHRGAVVAPVGNTVYAVLPARTSGGTLGASETGADRVGEHMRRSEQLAENVLNRLGYADLLVGIGDPVDDVAQLPRSRRQADAATRALLAGRHGSRRVASWREVQVDSLLLELAQAMLDRHEPIAAPLDTLLDGSPDNGDRALSTLRAYLDHFGDASAAARSLFVHPNTFRYRLRTLTRRHGLDLSDPDQRFAVLLQLRLLELLRRPTDRTGEESTIDRVVANAPDAVM